jgi:hypothetical protein
MPIPGDTRIAIQAAINSQMLSVSIQMKFNILS